MPTTTSATSFKSAELPPLPEGHSPLARVIPFPVAATPWQRTRRVYRRYVYPLDFRLFFGQFVVAWLLFLGLLLFLSF